LREAIKWAEEGMNILNLYTQNELNHLRVIVAAAKSQADHIDNEDPDGMQDRNCDTCKHEALNPQAEPCRTCIDLATNDRTYCTKWEPKEVDA
jgi:hypothetical protein